MPEVVEDHNGNLILLACPHCGSEHTSDLDVVGDQECFDCSEEWDPLDYVNDG